MAKGLANAHASAIVTARADEPFASVVDLWRRAALWAIKGLRDEELLLFATASERAGATIA